MGVHQPHLFTTMKSINNNHLYSDELPNKIGQFYKDKTILITGATGFLGKALLEKLVRSCDGIETIYLLIRPKRGLAIEQRIKELLKNPVFSRIKDTHLFQKIKIINGDVSQINLGLSEQDRTTLIDHVNIVFHSAATVKFNEDLRNAVVLNTLGTKRVLALCDQMKQLMSFVHVSTAFSNSDRHVVDEVVYKPVMEPNAIINCVEVLTDEALRVLADKLLGMHPNTYTLTKSMAEWLVFESSSMIPTAVVRPSIITSAWKEPFPGWVDNVSGITGIFMECGRGTIKSIICDEKCTMDLIPVDIVVNTLITAAWHTVAYRSNSMRVYNCTSGPTNPITWKEFGRLTHKYWLEYPSKYVTWYPGFTYRTNRILHHFCVWFFHLIPSAFLDVFMYCTNQKPIMLKISRKFYSALEVGKFFSTNEWDFKAETMVQLIDAVNHCEDGADFDLNMSLDNGFNWNFYVKEFALGVRKYVLKDDLSSLETARVKLNRLYWFQKAVQAVAVYATIKLITIA